MRKLVVGVLFVFSLAAHVSSGQETAEQEKRSESSRPAAEDAAETTRQTPFGRVKQDANPAPAPEPKKPSETGLVSAEVTGDTVTFRRRTPFGNQVWKKKRSELSDDEKQILANQSSPAKKTAAAKAGSNPAPKPAAKPAPPQKAAGKPE